MDKKQKKNITIVSIAGVSLILILLLLIQLVPFTQLPNGGGGGSDLLYDPSTEYGVGIPVLDEITPEIDYDGVINLEWSLESGYTITKFYIYVRYESLSWGILATLGNVYSYSLTWSTEGMYGFMVQGVATIDGEEHNSNLSDEQSVQVSFQGVEGTIPVLKAIESPNTDGTIELDWNEVTNPFGGSVSAYRIYRQFALGAWIEIDEVSNEITVYVDSIDENGEYQYYIKSVTYITMFDEVIISEASNIQIVDVNIGDEEEEEEEEEEVLPTNPTISINNGDTTTDSLTITLSLSCDNATKMQFLLYGTNLLSWVAYAETYIIEFSINGPNYPVYTIGVIFGNEGNLTTEMIYDSITYVEPTQEDDEDQPLPEDDEEDETDYTMIYVLVAVLVGGIGIIAFIQYRKKKKDNRPNIKKVQKRIKKGKNIGWGW